MPADAARADEGTEVVATATIDDNASVLSETINVNVLPSPTAASMNPLASPSAADRRKSSVVTSHPPPAATNGALPCFVIVFPFESTSISFAYV